MAALTAVIATGVSCRFCLTNCAVTVISSRASEAAGASCASAGLVASTMITADRLFIEPPWYLHCSLTRPSIRAPGRYGRQELRGFIVLRLHNFQRGVAQLHDDRLCVRIDVDVLSLKAESLIGV